MSGPSRGRRTGGAGLRRRMMLLTTCAGLAITLFAMAQVAHPRGVYWSRIVVRLQVPPSSVYPNSVKTTSQSLVMAAGALARIVDPSGGKKLLADQSVTLASEGFTHATQVTLPNSGGQFVTSFDTQELQVEAVGTTADEVHTRMVVALSRIDHALAALERSQTLSPRARIQAENSPATIEIYVQDGSRVRAVLAVALLGWGLTMVARHLVSTWGARRRDDAVVVDPIRSDRADPGEPDLAVTGGRLR